MSVKFRSSKRDPTINMYGLTSGEVRAEDPMNTNGPGSRESRGFGSDSEIG